MIWGLGIVSNEDKRTAVGASYILSGHLIAAALAMLTIESAFIAFALDKRDATWGFWLLAHIAAICFISSIVVAGKGITKSRDSGYEGNWDLKAGKLHFGGQATLCLVGLICISLAFTFSGEAKQSSLEKNVGALEQTTSTFEKRLNKASSERQKIREDIETIDSRIVQLAKNFQRKDQKQIKELFVIKDRVNVRKKPTLDSPIVLQFRSIRKLVEIDRKGEWVQVGFSHSEVIGWIQNSLVSSLASEEEKIDSTL